MSWFNQYQTIFRVDGVNKIDTEIDNASPTFAEPNFLNLASISRSSNNRKEKPDWCKMANPKTSLAGDHSMCIYTKVSEV